MRKLLILIFFLISILISCDYKHKIIVVSEITVEVLEKKLNRQKCHDKAIFIFDPDCPTCLLYLRKEYPMMLQKFSDSIDYIFISVDTIPLEQYKKIFNTIGIKSGQLFSLQENDPNYFYAQKVINISKIIQDLFPDEKNVNVDGYPISFMIDKRNKIKLEYYRIGDNSFIIRPQPWHKLYLSSLYEMDFNVIDDYEN